MRIDSLHFAVKCTFTLQESFKENSWTNCGCVYRLVVLLFFRSLGLQNLPAKSVYFCYCIFSWVLSAEAYDALDPTGNITIKRDIISWTPDDYVIQFKVLQKMPLIVTWNVTCTYSQFLAQKTPTCCVSLSSFYNDTIVSCPTCACGCNNATDPGVVERSSHLASAVPGLGKSTTPLLQCTSHMCPVRIHWHVKLNYKEYWRVKITITNFNYASNYSQWNLVVQHPNFDNLTQLFSFNYKPLTPYAGLNDTAMLWGLKVLQ
ncbi:COBRA-like protein 1 [Hibiscus syriacus]|uniref:COBRA-like protein 1 n=1 Tax=Hibiscus syriacus TaxID=106335 RepID=A0A6A2YYL6_HIBSY|nr:COBRA-like protein 1 [Hibiscus syriacus]